MTFSSPSNFPQVQNVESRSKHEEADEKNDQEVADRVDRLLDQSNEERRGIEKQQPVEHLEPQEAA